MRSKLLKILPVLVAVLASVVLPPRVVRADPPQVAVVATTQSDGITAAEKKLETAEVALMQARAAAAREYQNRPEYQKAVKDLADAFGAFNAKRNSLIGEVENDPRIVASKKQGNDTDALINDACRPNSSATPEQIEQLFKLKDSLARDVETIENDAMDRKGLAPLRKTWKEASDVLAGLMDRESDEVEKSDAVKAAVVAVQAARADANALAAHAPAADVDPVDDYLRRYPHAEVNRGLRDLEVPPAAAK